LRRPTVGVTHLIEDCLRSRRIEMCAPCGIHRGAVLDAVVRRLIGAEKPLDVIVERVIAQSRIHSKPMIVSLEARRVGGIAGCGVRVSELQSTAVAAGKRHTMDVDAVVWSRTLPLSIWKTY